MAGGLQHKVVSRSSSLSSDLRHGRARALARSRVIGVAVKPYVPLHCEYNRLLSLPLRLSVWYRLRKRKFMYVRRKQKVEKEKNKRQDKTKSTTIRVLKGREWGVACAAPMFLWSQEFPRMRGRDWERRNKNELGVVTVILTGVEGERPARTYTRETFSLFIYLLLFMCPIRVL